MTRSEEMVLSEEIRNIRQSRFLSQEDLAKELKVSFSTVNRWETGKTVPNCMMMRKIVQFCQQNDIDHQAVDEAWKESRNGSDEE